MKPNKCFSRPLLCAFFPVLLIILLILSSCKKDDYISPNLSKTGADSTKKLFSGSLSSNATAVNAGGLLHQQWLNAPGNTISTIPYRNTPSLTENLTDFVIPVNQTSNVANIVKGYIVAPQTGDYTFWISGGNTAELWLSSDDSQVNVVLIASLLSSTNALEWSKFASQKSKNISLVAGRKYFITALQKQGAGDGHLAVKWQMPNGQAEAPISGKWLMPYTETAAKVAGTYINSTTIKLYGVHDITISGLAIQGGSVPAIELDNCYNIHITGNKLYNSSDVGIHLYHCNKISIDNNYFTNVSTGVYVQGTVGGGIAIYNNQFLNMLGPLPRGQFVQFNNVNGPNCLISGNVCENILGQSHPEDAISLYMSNGTAASPIAVRCNRIRGGGPSETGGGIILGDAGGSNQLVEGNMLVNPGQYGIGVAGGTNMQILNNKIYAKQNTFTNVGICVWNQYTSTSSCAMIAVSGNQINWTAAGGYLNSGWNNGNCGAVEGWDNNSWSANLSAAILPATLITNK